MKSLYLSLLMTFSLLLGGCGEDENPTPSGPVAVQVRMTQVGNQAAQVFVRTESYQTNQATPQTHKSYDLNGSTRTESPGTYQRGQTVYLSVLYLLAGRSGYTPPAAGQSIQAELLVDGKVVGTARIDAASFGQAATWTDPGNTTPHKIHEVSIKL